MVAPLAGAWIEINGNQGMGINTSIVAPLAGAWIEMVINLRVHLISRSRTPRGCVD